MPVTKPSTMDHPSPSMIFKGGLEGERDGCCYYHCKNESQTEKYPRNYINSNVLKHLHYVSVAFLSTCTFNADVSITARFL